MVLLSYYYTLKIFLQNRNVQDETSPDRSATPGGMGAWCHIEVTSYHAMVGVS